ncbi:HD domain-containing protein [Streptomyces sp. NPDC004031]
MEQRDTRNTVRGSTVNGPVYQADSMHFHGGGPSGALLPAELADVDWAHAVFHSAVWGHVAAERDPAGLVRLHSAAVAARLAAVRDRACASRGPDPWYDPDLAVRFLARVEWLLGEPPAGGGGLDLYPVEAALFGLAPFLYQAHALDLAAELAPVAPQSLHRATEPDARRRSFEAFAEGYAVLVARAQRRPAAEGGIGWWLFHRWLLHSGRFAAPEAVGRLLTEALPGGEAAAVLGGTLTPERVSLLVHGLRRGPDVCNPDHLGRLQADERVRGPGPQQVREQRLCLLLALAYTAATEPTALPEIVVEHLGIPHPVDLGELRATLADAEWGGTAALPVFRAACHHEAVIEGLRAYVTRADELLLAVARTVRERVTFPVPALPARLSADGLAPARGVFSGWARFRLDERRIRSLLMGVQLYKDPGLAVRELYQNALDACRFRRARSRYLDATTPASYPYEGAITITQGLDEDGREYVECHDNGVGMGEAELRGVFANAGARFPEQADFRQEFAAWREHGIGFHPNSRFGIGVLSYFMLADEIRVTTCRMSRTGALGPLLEVSIFGPGHLFRIRELAERGSEPGTAVRLYLREGEFSQGSGWSCVVALVRVLGIAEFATTARDTAGEVRWEPGRLQDTRALWARHSVTQFTRSRGPALNAREVLAEWTGAPAGTHVLWCREGGALLVDGLVVDPGGRPGVLAGTMEKVRGVVLDLAGPYAPERLSADRTEVLESISEPAAALLRSAVSALAEGELPAGTFTWLCTVAWENPALADLLTTGLAEHGRTLDHGGWTFDLAAGGFLPSDTGLLSDVSGLPRPEELERRPHTGRISVQGPVPDPHFLWRLLAHRPQPAFAALAAYCPELADVRAVLPALPSDHKLLTDPFKSFGEASWRYGDWLTELHRDPDDLARATKIGAMPEGQTVHPGHLSSYARARGTSEADAAAELRALGHHPVDWMPDRPTGQAQQVFVHRALYADRSTGAGRRPVPLGHIAYASWRLDTPVSEVCAQLAGSGFTARPRGLPERPDRLLTHLLSRNLDGVAPWLDDDAPLEAGHLLAAADTLGVTVADAQDALTGAGLAPPPALPADAGPDDLALLRGKVPLGPPSEPAAYGPVLRFASVRQMPLSDVVARLERFGYAVPLRPPPAPGLLDRQLLDPSCGIAWDTVRAGDTVAFHRMLTAAQELHVEVPDVAERLASYGLACGPTELPPGLDARRAKVLLDETVRMDAGGEYPPGVGYLYRLSKLSHTLGAPLPQVVAWLNALGVDVPDLPALIRAALARVPRAE